MFKARCNQGDFDKHQSPWLVPAFIFAHSSGTPSFSKFSRLFFGVTDRLFEPGQGEEPRLRKQLVAPRQAIRPAEANPTALLPHEFVMKDLHRETSTVVRIDSFESSGDLSEKDFTRAALAAESKAAQPVAAPH